MDVTIIGAGNRGCGIGTRLVAGGNGVKILDNDPDEAARLTKELESGAGTTGAPKRDPRATR
jgi:predicted dinucleotide-binding enzyme